MEMINGEKKLHVWLYKYEQDGVGSLYDRNEIGEERSDNWIYRNNRKFIRVTFTF